MKAQFYRHRLLVKQAWERNVPERRAAARIEAHTGKSTAQRIAERMARYVGYAGLVRALDYTEDNGYRQIRSLDTLHADTLPYEVRVVGREAA